MDAESTYHHGSPFESERFETGSWKRLMGGGTSILMWGVIFGSIGFGFFVYGKKQQALIPLVCGLGLMVVPYVIANAYLLVLSGILMAVLPFLIRR